MAEEVIEDILWTNSAKASFNRIVEYLNQAWTEREIEKFITQTRELISKFKTSA